MRLTVSIRVVVLLVGLTASIPSGVSHLHFSPAGRVIRDAESGKATASAPAAAPRNDRVVLARRLSGSGGTPALSASVVLAGAAAAPSSTSCGPVSPPRDQASWSTCRSRAPPPLPRSAIDAG